MGWNRNFLTGVSVQGLAEKFASLMNQYSARAIAVGSGFDNNPSPGKYQGWVDHPYHEICRRCQERGDVSHDGCIGLYGTGFNYPGLNLLCTPGNDVESTTGLAGVRCQHHSFQHGSGYADRKSGMSRDQGFKQYDPV
jgi:altronate hydrolase